MPNDQSRRAARATRTSATAGSRYLPSLFQHWIRADINDMWQPDDICISAVELDFRSSGQSVWNGTQVRADDVQIVNARELVDWSEDPTQLLVCTECGFPHCARGGWTAMRRAGEFVILIPAFDAMLADRQSREEFAPPFWLRQRDACVLTADKFDALLPEDAAVTAGDLALFRSDEAVRLLQWCAPDDLLDRFPRDISVDERDFWEAAPSSLPEALDLLRSTLADWSQSTRPIELRPVTESDQLRSFFLDLPPDYEWSPLAITTEDDALHLGDFIAY